MTMELQDTRKSVIRVDQVFAASGDERGILSLVLFSGAVVTYSYSSVEFVLQDLQAIREKMNLAPWVGPTNPFPSVPSPYPVTPPDQFPWGTPQPPIVWYKWVTTSDSTGVYQSAPNENVKFPF